MWDERPKSTCEERNWQHCDCMVSIFKRSIQIQNVKILFFPPQLIQSRLWPVGAVVLQVTLTEK